MRDCVRRALIVGPVETDGLEESSHELEVPHLRQICNSSLSKSDELRIRALSNNTSRSSIATRPPTSTR